MEKLQTRRLSDAMSGDEELSGHLDNATHWLEEMAKALALLQELRKDHDVILHSTVPAPIGDATTGVLSEWAACKAQDILAEVLPQLVDQVVAYQEHLSIRSRRGRNEAKLQVEVAKLKDDLKEEKRRGQYYYKKLRELQQAQMFGDRVGITKLNAIADETVDDVPIYGAKDMQAMKDECEAKLEALEKEWQDLLDEERKKALSLQEYLEAEINALKAQIEALNRELEALRARLGQSRGNEESRESSDAHDRTASGGRLPSPGNPSSRATAMGGATSTSGGANSRRDRQSPNSSARDRSDARTTAGRSASASSSAEPPEHRHAMGESPTDPTFSRSVSPSGRWLKGGVLVNEEDEHRRLAEELKRRVFEKVLNEERARQSLMDEEDQAALIARFESQGWGELINLIRRIDDTMLRRDIFRLLKMYHKRSTPPIEIVCMYCRRKPRPDQIHTYDVPSRPSSANKTAGRTGSVANLVTAPPDSAIQPLPRVSSSPSVVLGLPQGAKAFEEISQVASAHGRQDGRRPSKLVAVLPAAASKHAKGRPRSAPAPAGLRSTQRMPAPLPTGWAITNAAS